MPDIEHLNILCGLCQTLSSRVQWGDRIFFDFHSIEALTLSAAAGCHCCSIIESELSPNIIRDDTRALWAELHWRSHYGIALLIRQKRPSSPEVLITMELEFISERGNFVPRFGV